MHNDHLEFRIKIAEKAEKAETDTVLIKETGQLIKAEELERLMLKRTNITVGRAQRIVKEFFCECIENGIMEVDVVDANAEICKRLEMGWVRGKKIDG